MRHLFFILILVTILPPAYAHKASDSYLSVAVGKSNELQVQWDIALRDLDYALGLDDNEDGQLTWGELRAHHASLASYVLARLTITTDDYLCTAGTPQHLVDYHSDGAYAVLRFDITCPTPHTPVKINYRLFADLDPQHRGLLRWTQAGVTQSQSAIFSPAQPTREFKRGKASGDSSVGQQFLDYLELGINHILEGYDHLLFLLTLLLPAVLWRDGKTWRALPALRPALWEVTRIVTAFTFAHSVTLTLAAWQLITVPSRLVESVIAASVILAALNNIYPVVVRKRWLMALLCGFIHGCGFATVLTDLGLQSTSLALSLVAFNVGIELAQLAIVVVFLPLAFKLRHAWIYPNFLLRVGSVGIAVLGIVWLVERVFDIALMSGS